MLPPGPLRAIALLVLLLPAAGQAQTPAREGNTWDWRHHQPTRAGVHHRERSAGVALSPSQRKALNKRVNRLGQNLLGKRPGHAASAPGDRSLEGRQ